jgi:hypothetical protein
MIPVLAGAADLKIDHVTVAGRDIKQLQAKLAAVGIESVYGGAHANSTTEMAMVSFPDGSYLELIAIQAKAAPEAVKQHVWGALLEADAGPAAWALREDNIEAEVKRLRAAGIAVSAPVPSGRTRPDGVHLEWQTSDIGTELRGTFFPFLIQDLTSRDQRAFPQGKPGSRNFQKVSRVVIGVHNLDAAIEKYRQAFGLPAALKQVDKEFGAHLAMAGSAPVILAQPLTSDSWLAARIERFGEGPCAFILATRRPVVSKTQWFGSTISWFDEQKLGWRLGSESAR